MTEVIDTGLSGSKFNRIESIKSRTNFVLVALSSSLILNTIHNYLNYQFMQQFKEDVSIRRLPALLEENTTLNTVSMLNTLFLILTIVAVCMWFYRANKNLHTAGLKSLEYTPGWAVGWFFIPFANFYYPYAVMREIVKGTKHISERNTDDFKSEKDDSRVLLWWISYLLPGISLLFVLKITTDPLEMLQNAVDSSGIQFGLYFITIISGLVLMSLMHAIYKMQEPLSE